MSEREELRSELERLLGEEESLYLEFKLDLKLQTRGDKAEFVKDILAMANTREISYIVTGVDPETRERKGITLRHSPDGISQTLIGKTDPSLTVEYAEFDVEGRIHGIVRIQAGDPPYLVGVHDKFGGQVSESRKVVHVTRGTFYVRKPNQNIGGSRADLDRIYQAKSETPSPPGRELEIWAQEEGLELQRYIPEGNETWVSFLACPATHQQYLDLDNLPVRLAPESILAALEQARDGLEDLFHFPFTYEHHDAGEDTISLVLSGRPGCPRERIKCDLWGRISLAWQCGREDRIWLDGLHGIARLFVRSLASIYRLIIPGKAFRTPIELALRMANFKDKILLPSPRGIVYWEYQGQEDPRLFPSRVTMVKEIEEIEASPNGIAGDLIKLVRKSYKRPISS